MSGPAPVSAGAATGPQTAPPAGTDADSAVEVVLHHLCDDPDQVLAAYHAASRRMSGTPGLLGNQLLARIGDQRGFVVISRWSDWAAFATWEASAGHKDQTAPLRPFRDTERDRPFELYREIARYDGG